MKLIVTLNDLKVSREKAPDNTIELSFPDIELTKEQHELFMQGLSVYLTRIQLKHFYHGSFGQKSLTDPVRKYVKDKNKLK